MEVAAMIILLGACWIISLQVSDSGRCPTADDADRCCTGERMINETCEKCVGFFGENCENPCPPTFYGTKCTSKCNCTEDQACNSFVGCLPVLSTLKNISLQDGNQSSPDLGLSGSQTCGNLLMGVFALGGSQILLLVLCVMAICIKCCRTSPQRENREENSSEPCGMGMGTSESLVEQNVSCSHYPDSSLTTRDNGAMYLQSIGSIDKEISSFPLDYYDTTVSVSRMQRQI